MGKDVLEIIVGRIEKAKSFAVVVQETWRKGDYQEGIGKFLFINHGANVEVRGKGLGMILSPEAREAWKAVGSGDPVYFGAVGRMMAIEVLVSTGRGGRGRARSQKVGLTSGYAPTLGGALGCIGAPNWIGGTGRNVSEVGHEEAQL